MRHPAPLRHRLQAFGMAAASAARWCTDAPRCRRPPPLSRRLLLHLPCSRLLQAIPLIVQLVWAMHPVAPLSTGLTRLVAPTRQQRAALPQSKPPRHRRAPTQKCAAARCAPACSCLLCCDALHCCRTSGSGCTMMSLCLPCAWDASTSKRQCLEPVAAGGRCQPMGAAVVSMSTAVKLAA